MLLKSGLFLFLLTVLQVSARYKSVEPILIENEMNPDPAAISSSSSRIVSGWEAQPGQFPYHAALRMINSTGGLRQSGGSIVSKEWVITTSHCTINRILAIVRAGVVSLTNPEYIFETSEWYTHPQYNQSASLQPFDIALIKLQRPLVYTRLVKPIRIQSRADAFRDYDGQQVIVSGHGRTDTFGPYSDVLRWVYLRAISDEACQRTYAMVRIANTVCARFYNVTSQNACFGDDGGPLVHVDSDGIPTLIGVSYFFPGTANGCGSGLPTGYIRPGIFLPWFEEVTGIDFENLQEGDNDTIVDNTTTSTNPTSDNPSSTTPTLTTTSPSTPTPTVTEDFPPKETTTAQPEDSEEKEEEDSDSSESNEDDDIAQLLKRLQVDVKVKVKLDKFNITKVVGNDVNVWKP
ncbi:hypothetical protein PYW07_008268 [Mythimna separata]|uniref:Peptidase S1 domain-containing protein n=1 Tax=Mythimna separata TaxID=271217 RepID=A0AAD7YCS7_MYTSE|nr:hypothetical protein PYW07_008268 [Mythimna separata]